MRLVGAVKSVLVVYGEVAWLVGAVRSVRKGLWIDQIRLVAKILEACGAEHQSCSLSELPPQRSTCTYVHAILSPALDRYVHVISV